jgi:hypothetical protein
MPEYSSSYPTYYFYDMPSHSEPKLKIVKPLKHKKRKHHRRYESTDDNISKTSRSLSPKVRLLIQDTRLSSRDEYVVVGVKHSLNIRLPRLKRQIPVEEHNQIHSAHVISIFAPRTEGIHTITTSSDNNINLDSTKKILLRPGETKTCIAYGKTWFIH